jgi:MoxR-like ATPase
MDFHKKFGEVTKGREMFKSIIDVQERFEGKGYLCNRQVATVIYLATRMKKPVLVEGPPGVGKTELGKTLAEVLGIELIRLQCYEGLDETKALYEWKYAKQLLYTQILKDKIGNILNQSATLQEAVDQISEEEDVFFSERFLEPRPLLKAILADEPTVLLIDEVDRSDPEFEAFLLEVLSDFQVSIPELGTLRAKHIPLVILTSNNSREMTDALKRRCLHLYIPFPEKEEELRMLQMRMPNLSETLARQIVEVVYRLRKMDLKKSPSISETLDWAKSLMVLNADKLDQTMLDMTLNLILKYERDIEKVRNHLPQIMKEIH